MPEAPQHDRAAPLYLQALAEMGEHLTAETIAPALDGTLRPGQPQWEVAKRYADDRRAAIVTVREAASRPVLGLKPTHGPYPPEEQRARAARFGEPPPAHAPPATDVPLHFLNPPLLSTLREFGQILAVDAAVAAAEGDAERVAADIRAICGLARHAGEPPMPIAAVLRAALDSLASQTATTVLERYPGVLGPGLLAAIQRDLDAPRPALRFEGERLCMEDSIARLYTDEGDGEGRLSVEKMREFRVQPGGSDPFLIAVYREAGGGAHNAFKIARAAATDPGRRIVRQTWAAYIDAAEREAAKHAWEANVRGVWACIEPEAGAPDSIVLRNLAPALPGVAEAHHTAHHAREAAAAAVALHRHALATGAWARSLNDLVPEFLPQTPRDMFTGEPLRYRPPGDAEASPTLYSVGSDKDDDGGRRVNTKPTAKYDGDWVFLGGVPAAPREAEPQ